MTTYTDRQLDQILDQFLGEGPAAAPERAIDGALVQIEGERQRRSPIVPERFHMSMPVRLLLAAVLTLAILGAGALFIGSRPSDPTVVPEPSPSASPAASASPTDAPSPDATPGSSPAASQAAVSPAIALSQAALQRVDAAIEAAKGAGGPVSTDQTRLFRLTDEIRTPLGERNLAGGLTAFEPLQTAAAEVAATLDEATGAGLRTAVATLGGVLRAAPFPAGDVPAGTYHASIYTPTIAVTLPDGWSRGLEDSEVLTLRKGGVTLAFTRMATATSAVGLAKALGASDPASLDHPPAAVTLPSYSGFAAGFDGGGGTLWLTESLQAFDAAPTDAVRSWALDVRGRPVTVDVVGPPAEVEAVLPEVEAMLGSLVASDSAVSPAAGPVPAGTYWCKTLAAASEAIVRDGFTVGKVSVTPEGPTTVPETWLVLTQVPNPGVRLDRGSPVDLVLAGPSNTASSCS